MLLREAMNFVKSNTKNGWVKLPDGRKNKPEYAERAVLEAMVNHFIHRDYTVIGGKLSSFRSFRNPNAHFVEQINWQCHHKQRECVGSGGDDGGKHANCNYGVTAVLF